MAMKCYTISFADSVTHTPEHPERTTKRSLSWDVQYKVWPSREAMLKSLHVQGRRPSHRLDWRECKSEYFDGSMTKRLTE